MAAAAAPRPRPANGSVEAQKGCLGFAQGDSLRRLRDGRYTAAYPGPSARRVSSEGRYPK
jgi:hypothetical protein